MALTWERKVVTIRMVVWRGRRGYLVRDVFDDDDNFKDVEWYTGSGWVTGVQGGYPPQLDFAVLVAEASRLAEHYATDV